MKPRKRASSDLNDGSKETVDSLVGKCCHTNMRRGVFWAWCPDCDKRFVRQSLANAGNEGRKPAPERTA